MTDRGQTILFTTFEPSGDALAARTITTMLQRRPDLHIYALGGPKMAEAGARVIETTTAHASMFLETVAQAWSHHRRLCRLKKWLKSNKIDALVPVDSPAANWSICGLVRRYQPRARIVHLVAPQLWAWASWRIRRMRRLSDKALCLLPFEPVWFQQRDMPATFVGHPVFDAAAQPTDAGAAARPALPDGSPRLAMLPGSRTGEVKKNWPTMLAAFDQLKDKHPELTGVVASLDQRTEKIIRSMLGKSQRPGGGRDDLTVVTGQTDAVLKWCDAALVKSGTVTLQVAARRVPMVTMYNMSYLFVQLLGRWLIFTRTFTLPNLVSEWAGLGRVVPELIPHFGEVTPVVREVDALLGDTAAARMQREGLSRIADYFTDKHFAEDSAREILGMLEEKAHRHEGT